jgi:hypothetical protein
MILQFDTHGNEKQKLCARYWNDPVVTDIVYGGSKGSAKSYTGCSLIFGSGLIYPETHWFIARKKLNDLRKFTIPSIHEVFGHWKLNDNYYNYNGQDNYFDLYNKSRVYLLDAKYLPSDPLYQRFGSMQMTGGWIEEAGEFESASKQNLQASIGRWKNDVYGITGTLLQTCNPSHNYLYREYYKPFKEGALPDYRKFIQALPSDNKMLPAGYLENLNRILSKSDKERLLYGNWEYDDDPARLMSYEDILHVFDKREMPEERRMFITADIARFGSDLLVIGVWKGWELFEIHTMEKSRITEAHDLVEVLRVKYNVTRADVVIDEDGIGGGVVDLGRYSGFMFLNKPIAETRLAKMKKVPSDYFKNLGTQCAFRAAEMVTKKELWISADITPKQKDCIIEEMEQIKSDRMDDEVKLQLVSKKVIKEKIGRSPDYWDMIKMRFYRELKKPVELDFTR